MSSRDSLINHLTMIRVDSDGEGELLVYAHSFEQIRTRASNSITLSNPMDKFGSTLSNFQSQRIQIEIAVDDIEHWFKFSSIIPFIKPTATSYPNG